MTAHTVNPLSVLAIRFLFSPFNPSSRTTFSLILDQPIVVACTIHVLVERFFLVFVLVVYNENPQIIFNIRKGVKFVIRRGGKKNERLALTSLWIRYLYTYYGERRRGGD